MTTKLEPPIGACELFARALRREIQLAIDREPGLTRAELATRMLPESSATSAPSAVRRYLTGQQWPSDKQLDLLAKGLGIPVSRLLSED